MPRHPTRRIGLVLIAAAVAGLAAPARAQRPSPVDPAMDAFRLQAREREERKRALFDRLRRVPEAPPAEPVRLLVPDRPFPDAQPGGLLVRTVVERGDGPRDEGGDEPEEAPPPRLRNVLAPENFDMRVFGDLVGDDVRRARVEVTLGELVERASAVHRLTPTEREKLRLAGRGDVKRFFDRIAEDRRAFDRVRFDPGGGIAFLREVRSERRVYVEGPFGAGSLFEKTLARALRERRDAATPR